MKRTLFIIGCAMCVAFDRLCGRELAINAVAEEKSDAPPTTDIGGVSGTAVAARRQALIAAGTPSVYADKFALDAELQQAWHDADPKKREQTQALPGTPAEREAAAIIDAQKLEKSKLQPTSEKKADEKSEVIERAGNAAAQTVGALQTNMEGATA